MDDLEQQLRTLVDEAVIGIEPVDAEEAMTRRSVVRPHRPARPRRLLAVAAVVALVALTAVAVQHWAGTDSTVVRTGGSPSSGPDVRPVGPTVATITTTPAPLGSTTVPRRTTPSTAPTTSTTTAPTTTSTTTVPTTTTLSPAELQASLAQFASRYGTPTNRSAVVPGNGGDVAAISYNVRSSGTHPHVAVVQYGSAGWHVVSDITLDIGGEVLSGGSIGSVDITGGGTPDFAVLVDYNAGGATAIIADTAGHWHALPFHGPATLNVDEVLNANIRADGTVTDSVDNCIPDCASGSQTTNTYRYSAAVDAMVLAG